LLHDPPGWHRLWSHGLPHWRYLQAVDQALTNRGIPPGIVRADVVLRPYHEPDRHETIYMRLVREVSRTGALGGVRPAWDNETGWPTPSSAPVPAVSYSRRPSRHCIAASSARRCRCRGRGAGVPLAYA
jgi:hypothetical protein